MWSRPAPWLAPPPEVATDLMRSDNQTLTRSPSVQVAPYRFASLLSLKEAPLSDPELQLGKIQSGRWRPTQGSGPYLPRPRPFRLPVGPGFSPFDRSA